MASEKEDYRLHKWDNLIPTTSTGLGILISTNYEYFRKPPPWGFLKVDVTKAGCFDSLIKNKGKSSL